MKRRTSADPSPSRFTRSPQVLRPVLEVGPEQRQVVPRRAEVVVDDVLHDPEPGGVAGVDEALVRRRPAVRLGDREPVDAVVAPVAGAVERVDRHQLDQVDADRAQVVELLDRGVEGALGREGADVELVDHRAGELSAGPGVVGPGEPAPGRRCASAAWTPLAGAATAGPGVACRVVDQVAVVEQASPSGPAVSPSGDPPVAVADRRISTIASRHRQSERAAPAGAHTANGRGGRGVQTAHGPPPGSAARPGRSASSSWSGASPAYSRPVSRSAHSPSGSGSVVSPQPRAASPTGQPGGDASARRRGRRRRTWSRRLAVSRRPGRTS